MSPLILPALGAVAGAGWGAHYPVAASISVPALLAILALTLGAYARSHTRPAAAAGAVAALLTGLTLASAERDAAERTPLRLLLDARFGGFAVDTPGPPAPHDPILTRFVLLEDAAWSEEFTSLRVSVREVRLGDRWRRADGGVTLSVSGRIDTLTAEEWVAGRIFEAPVTFRRPARYLNDGVPDMELDLALGGTTLFGSIKSSLLITRLAGGSAMQEMAARIRRRTRRAVASTVGRHAELSAAIVTAVLIGDRTGLPDAVRQRLQAAGTYHVIAISGGNIAIFALLSVGLFVLIGAGRRVASFLTIIVLVAYACVVTAGPSVWRATAMAMMYLAARSLDHRSARWHACAAAALVMVIARPLDVRDAGFLLTFGATAALLEVAHRVESLPVRWRSVRWLATGAAASLATEVALMPVSAATFSRVTAAGLLLNFIAVPVMGVVQVAGMAAAAAHLAGVELGPAAWAAHAGATVLIESARLVDVIPWLTARVPSPHAVVIGVYYIALGLTLFGRPMAVRVIAAAFHVGALLTIVSGTDARALLAPAATAGLRLTLFDVGQAESMLLELPDGSRSLIDAAGVPFGSGTFDIGGRVLAPALWARGVRRLDAFLITHGDPDHVGGAMSLAEDFDPQALWEGVVVPRHVPTANLRDGVRASGGRLRELRAGMQWTAAGARVRVLHPADPDWERRRVRNDDSVVIEIVYGDVALLLTGDIAGGIEHELAPRLSPARIRILKVAHHGSRTSTSPRFLADWRPHVALISAGRGNRFGHPAKDVLARLEAAGTRVYRTDLHGQITLTTDGHSVGVTTFSGGVNDR